MFTAKITNKERTAQGLQITVEFTNGSEAHTETVIPQDKAGFDYWFKSRLTTLNTAVEMDADFNVGDELTVEETPTPEPTKEELEREEWIALWKRYKKAEMAMDALKRAGVEPTPEETAAFNALLSEVASKRKPEYYAYI